MRVYDNFRSGNPRPIGFMEVEGLACTVSGGPVGANAYASALAGWLHGTISSSSSTCGPEPGRVRLVAGGCPGMAVRPSAKTPPGGSAIRLAHAFVADDIAMHPGAIGGLTILDVTDKSAPNLLAHRNWCPLSRRDALRIAAA